MNWKKWIFIVCCLGFAYVCTELFSYELYRFFYKTPFSFTAISEQRTAILQDADAGSSHHELRIVHPFVGYVSNVNSSHPPALETPYGFFGEQDPIAASANPDTAIVAITGGSVACRFFFATHTELRHDLEQLPMFRGRKVIIVLLGQEAYAQPEQLFSIAYYLLQGGRLDLLINIDGYNDAVLGFEQQRAGIYPAFPEYWVNILSVAYKVYDRNALADFALWNHIRHAAAYAADQMRFSVTAQTLWSMLDLYSRKHMVEAEQKMRADDHKRPYFLSGPDIMNKASRSELADFEMRFWQRGSLGLFHLAQEYGFHYFHFLQPCLYIPGSKPLSAKELAQSYTPERFRPSNLTYMYPRLKAGIEQLRTQGVKAYNLADIYKETSTTIYADNNCHLNKLGNDMLAKAISQRIIEALSHTHGT